MILYFLFTDIGHETFQRLTFAEFLGILTVFDVPHGR